MRGLAQVPQCVLGWLLIWAAQTALVATRSPAQTARTGAAGCLLSGPMADGRKFPGLVENRQNQRKVGITYGRTIMDRRTFVGTLAAAGAVTPILHRTAGAAQSAPKVRNVVLVHGLFADGSCWAEVVARLQATGMKATAVQNPLTTLESSVAATQRALALQDGPTVLVGHSFAGMIVTEAGV